MGILPMRGMPPFTLFCALLCAVLTGCGRGRQGNYEGYVNADYVLVSSPAAGRLASLRVARGAQVKAGAELFALDPQPEMDALAGAEADLAAAEATLADLKKGARPSELETIAHQQKAALAAQTYADVQLKRSKDLYRTKVVAAENLNLYQSADIALMELAASFGTSLETARLGGRDDQIAAAAAQVDSERASVRQARWNLDQKVQRAGEAGLVFDTLFRPGEWVPAGTPVVSLLPPEGIRVRFFVPEPSLASLKVGGNVTVSADGTQPVAGRISFVSPTAEYSPPVIFSRESRAQLVFMVEASFDPGTAAALHPGQPVSVAGGAR